MNVEPNNMFNYNEMRFYSYLTSPVRDHTCLIEELHEYGEIHSHFFSSYLSRNSHIKVSSFSVPSSKEIKKLCRNYK